MKDFNINPDVPFGDKNLSPENRVYVRVQTPDGPTEWEEGICYARWIRNHNPARLINPKATEIHSSFPDGWKNWNPDYTEICEHYWHEVIMPLWGIQKTFREYYDSSYLSYPVNDDFSTSVWFGQSVHVRYLREHSNKIVFWWFFKKHLPHIDSIDLAAFAELTYYYWPSNDIREHFKNCLHFSNSHKLFTSMNGLFYDKWPDWRAAPNKLKKNKGKPHPYTGLDDVFGVDCSMNKIPNNFKAWVDKIQAMYDAQTKRKAA